MMLTLRANPIANASRSNLVETPLALYAYMACCTKYRSSRGVCLACVTRSSYIANRRTKDTARSKTLY